MVLFLINLVCHNACNDCISGGLYGCKDCQEGLLFYQGSCLVQCPFKTYQNGNQCLPCIFPCDECLSSSYCLTCLEAFNMGDGTCKSTCLDGMYLDKKIKICLRCSSICKTCIGSKNGECTSCYYNKGYILEEGYCRKIICQPGTYLDIDTLPRCLKCDSACRTCDGIGNTKCFECNKGYVSTPMQDLKMVKCDLCPKGFYSDNNGVCQGIIKYTFRNMRGWYKFRNGEM